MQTLSDIRALLASHGLRPKHRLGQNFLHDHNLIRKLVDAAAIQPGELVLEVGPGTGALTEALLDAGATVIACEIDPGMAAIIEERLGVRITLIHADVLEKQRALNPAVINAIGSRPFRLVANLPYQIASPLMTSLLIDHPECTGQFVTIQREVAERLAAPPSTKEYGPLTIIVQALAEVQRIAVLPASCFWPSPKVESAMVAIHPCPSGRGAGGEGVVLESADQRRAFARFITMLFTKRRKQVGTTLGREHDEWMRLAAHGITPNLRPEALTVPQLLQLHQVFPAAFDPQSAPSRRPR